MQINGVNLYLLEKTAIKKTQLWKHSTVTNSAAAANFHHYLIIIIINEYD